MGKGKFSPVEQVGWVEKQVKAIDELIDSGRLVVDMVQGTAAIDSCLYIYYNRPDDDKLMMGFCQMLRTWIKFQRAWKKGELLRLLDEGAYNRIAMEELTDMIAQKHHHPLMKQKIAPPTLDAEKLKKDEVQLKAYLEEYINGRYCPWPDSAPILVVCIDSQGNGIATIEQTNTPLHLKHTAL